MSNYCPCGSAYLVIIIKLTIFHRSKLHNWFLVLTAESKDIERDRKELYEPLIKELRLLEDGIGDLKCGLVAHFGDNLEVIFFFFLIVEYLELWIRIFYIIIIQ